MNSNELVPRESEWLASEDIKPHGAVTVTIESVSRREITLNRPGAAPEKGPKGLIKFKGKRRELVLNRTNKLMLDALYGMETDDWIGKQVTLVVERVKGPKGKMVDGIRIKAPNRRSRNAEDV